MPKMKTNRAAAKRLKRTASGKMKRFKANHSHILTKKTRRRRFRLRSSDLVAKSDQKRMDRLMPFGK